MNLNKLTPNFTIQIVLTYHIILRYFRVVRVGVVFSRHIAPDVDDFYRRFLIHCSEKRSCV